MVTTRDTGCSCYESWVGLARAAGYRLQLHDLDHDERFRLFGRTEAAAGCHMTQIDVYLIEGHVPLAIVERLLRERRKTRGIGIAGVPTEIAGMGGPKAPAIVMTLDARPRASVCVDVMLTILRRQKRRRRSHKQGYRADERAKAFLPIRRSARA